MVKKKTKIDDLEDFEMEEEEAPEVVEEIEEKPTAQEDVVNNFIKVIDDRVEKLTTAISTNQKYIKGLYSSQKIIEEKLEKVQDNFNILLEETK